MGEDGQSHGLRHLARTTVGIVPGFVLCVGIAAVATGAQLLEERLFSHPFIEALVLALLLGTILRTVWSPPTLWRPGIAFSAKPLLEFAIVLLGASVSFRALLGSGAAVIAGVVGTVVLALGAGYGTSRLVGLPRRVAVLVACGNAICGNSAIAAVAPVIGARAAEVASTIAFTAIFGVVVVLALPLALPLLGLSETQYGTLAGLTVYAVPQVLAATVPVGVAATQVGTLVKLIRVLMLGPLVFVLSLLRRHLGDATPVTVRPGVPQLVPWFILGFLLLAPCRSAGLVPEAGLRPLALVSACFTVVAMAALGLGVDVRTVGRAGIQVTAAVTVSLAVLFAIGLVLIRVLGIG